MMNWQNVIMRLQSESAEAVRGIAENPKTLVAMSAFSTAAGVGGMMQWLSWGGSILAAFGGLVGVGVLARLNWLKGETEKERRKCEKARYALLSDKAKAAGFELEEDEE